MEFGDLGQVMSPCGSLSNNKHLARIKLFSKTKNIRDLEKKNRKTVTGKHPSQLTTQKSSVGPIRTKGKFLAV